MELFLACVVVAAVLIGACVVAAVFNRAVLEPFIKNIVNKWFEWRGKPECIRVRYTAFDASGKVAFTADMPVKALERIIGQKPDHAAEVAMDGVVMERVLPQQGESRGVALPNPLGPVVSWPGGD